MKKKVKDKSVFEQIMSGLEDSLAHSRGELELVTYVVPFPPQVTARMKTRRRNAAKRRGG